MVALMMLKTGLTLGLLAVVWGAGKRGSGKRSKGRRGGKEGREGNKQPGLEIQSKFHIKQEITDERKTGWMKLT